MAQEDISLKGVLGTPADRSKVIIPVLDTNGPQDPQNLGARQKQLKLDTLVSSKIRTPSIRSTDSHIEEAVVFRPEAMLNFGTGAGSGQTTVGQIQISGGLNDHMYAIEGSIHLFNNQLIKFTLSSYGWQQSGTGENKVFITNPSKALCQNADDNILALPVKFGSIAKNGDTEVAITIGTPTTAWDIYTSIVIDKVYIMDNLAPDAKLAKFKVELVTAETINTTTGVVTTFKTWTLDTPTQNSKIPFSSHGAYLLDQKIKAIPQNIYKEAVLMGNSLVDQESWLFGGMVMQGAQGVFNWANWMCGAPFHFVSNLGVSGDEDENIFSRISEIPAHIDSVFMMFGTNNAQKVPSTANMAQVDALIDSMIGPNGCYTLGLAKLKAAGKNVCVCTIPPRNVGYVENDIRFKVLDVVNAWLVASPAAGRCTAHVDICSVFLDSTQPTWRKFKADYSSDGTHYSNKAGYAGGVAAIPALKLMYSLSKTTSLKYRDRMNPIKALGAMRTLPNVPNGNNAGTGTVASGWALSKNAVGTPTITASLVPYTVGANYVGPDADPNLVGVDEKFQQFIVANAAGGLTVTFGLYDALTKANGLGISPGDTYFVTAEVVVENATGLKTVSIGGFCYFDADKDGSNNPEAADQPYTDTNWHCKTQAGLCQNGTADQVLDANTSYRQILITDPVRVPEEIDSSKNLILVFNIEANFGAAGGGTFRIARPRIWRKTY